MTRWLREMIDSSLSEIRRRKKRKALLTRMTISVRKIDNRTDCTKRENHYYLDNKYLSTPQFVCLALFASSALAAPAPQQDTSALVDTILSQLDGTIDAAIQAALGASQDQFGDGKTLTNFKGTFSQVCQVQTIQ